MSHYGISKIHWNAQLGEVDQVLLHKVVPQSRLGKFSLQDGNPASSGDVVGLIRGGGKVWVMASVGSGSYQNTDHVDINPRKRDYLYSCTRSGRPTAALTNLPRYRLFNDPPN